MPKKTRSKSRDNLREGIPLTPWIKKKNYRTRIIMKERQSR
jgi:hypothetical protein